VAVFAAIFGVLLKLDDDFKVPASARLPGMMLAIALDHF